MKKAAALKHFHFYTFTFFLLTFSSLHCACPHAGRNRPEEKFRQAPGLERRFLFPGARGDLRPARAQRGGQDHDAEDPGRPARPRRGSVFVDGQLYHREHHELKRRIAYVPDQPFLYYKLTGEEHLNFYQDLYKIPYAKRLEKIDFFFKYFEFEEYRTELVENYSAGTRQKLLIAQALAVEPRLLLLDEPLVSIDPLVGGNTRCT